MLTKTNVNINFSQGLDTKTDPLQVSPGKFLKLENTVFTKGGLLQKRNGYGALTTLPNTTSSYLTTFGGNLIAISNTLEAYSQGQTSWINRGKFQPLDLNTTPVVRSALDQIQCDTVTSTNGLVCTVFTDLNNNLATYNYVIQDSTTGQNIVNPTPLAVNYAYVFTVSSANATAGATYTNNGVTFTVRSTIASGTTLTAYGNGKPNFSGTLTKASGTGDATITFSRVLTTIYTPKVFLLGGYFIVAYPNIISNVFHLQFIAISTSNSSVVTSPADIAQVYVPSSSLSWDGAVVGGNLYISYNTTSGGQQVDITYLSSSLAVASPQTFVGSTATTVSVCADISNPIHPVIYSAFFNAGSSTGFVVAVDATLNKLMTPTQIISSGTIENITSTANNGVVTVVYETQNFYSYDSAIPTNFLTSVPVTLPATVTTGTVGSTHNFIRSVGLASKAFVMNGIMYMLGAYQSPLQNTYFLFDVNGNIIARLAYENGGGYLALGLPQAQIIGDTVNFSYLYADLIQSQNTQGLIQSIGPAGATNIYSQTGINLASYEFSSTTLSTSEIGANLNLSGGMLWSYDGQTIGEQGFHLFPDSIETSWSTSGGAIHAQPDGSTNTNAYYYQVIYQWSDAQGNIKVSAPSVPVGVTTTGSGTSGSITLDIPTLRLSYKTNIKIIIYRWSVANQTYYQVTSIAAPTLNTPLVDSIAYVDTLADSSIIGNSIIYTTGGTVEDIPGPASTATTLFDDRLWLVDAEDQNLLWFSKQVIEATPVEMSDLFTFYIAPTTGAQGSTGKITALAPMDDKLIIFKKDAIYYINGTGPDNTGLNSQYNGPVFIISTVGCANQNSIVLTPNGLMFQSDKGIWLLGRDLSTNYIGAPVEEFNSSTVNSANVIPGTNQVRFTLNTGQTLMYDYYYEQWGTFANVPAVSSTLYESLHTYINSSGQVFQETPGQYLDNGNPVQLSFITSWYNFAGLQGYQRAYFFYLLGTYLSPHKVQVQIAYDYNPSPTQNDLIKPNNFSSAVPSPFGEPTPFGGPGNIEQSRVFLKRQRCQSFQLIFNEIYDPTLGVAAGAGLTLSGINLIYATKKGFRPISASNSFGGGSA